jgi:hypothetical protein
MVELTETELRLLDSIWDEELQSVLRDIKDCNYAHLRTQFTKQHSVMMEQLLGLPLPPPMRPWSQRQSQHYTTDEVWNVICTKMEAMPVLRSTILDRLLTKFQVASQVPHPNQNAGLEPLAQPG